VVSGETKQTTIANYALELLSRTTLLTGSSGQARVAHDPATQLIVKNYKINSIAGSNRTVQRLGNESGGILP
jgi:hypothetical protein